MTSISRTDVYRIDTKLLKDAFTTFGNQKLFLSDTIITYNLIQNNKDEKKGKGDDNFASGNEIDFVTFILTNNIDMHMTTKPK